MFNFFRQSKKELFPLSNSSLFDEKIFYQTFLKDLTWSKNEVIIESPFITEQRANMLMPIFRKLVNKGVKVFIVTRNPREHEAILEEQAEKVITAFEVIGVQVFLCIGNHHRKLAIIDRKILWEGSLNILSQTQSREIMRRIYSQELALGMFSFLKFEKYL